MRTLFLLPVLLLFATSGTYAQIGFGPEVGIGFSTMKFIPPVPYTTAAVSPVFSGRIGGLIDIPLNKHIYFQSGLSFSRKGAVRSYSYYLNDSFNESLDEVLTLNYMELPLGIVYKSGMQGRGRFILGIGAVPSYLLGGRNKTSGHLVSALVAYDTSFSSTVTAGQTFRGFDIGVHLSAGYELPTGLFFRAFCNMGVTDISPYSDVDKNRMFGISAGYIFGKGRNINKEAGLIDKSNDQ